MLLHNVSKQKMLSTLLLCLSSPIAAVYGIDVSGLSIQSIAAPLYDATYTGNYKNNKGLEHLNDILRDSHYRPNEGVGVSISLLEDDIIDSESSTDTDEEGRLENNEEKQSGAWISFAMNNTELESTAKNSTQYKLSKNEVNTNQGSFTENLCSKLARDTYHIANAHTSPFTRSATTCLCVVLRDQSGYAKKFVFHNGKDKMGASMAQKAEELKYAIRTGAHAEAEFIQFLLQRNQQNVARYTHVLGIGCSRKHCIECDCLLKLFLGKTYYMFTAAMREEHALPVVTDTEKGCNTCPKIHAELIYRSNAINKDGKRSNRYYLPQVLQEHIKEKVALDLDFSADRFKIEDEENVIARRQRNDEKKRAKIA